MTASARQWLAKGTAARLVLAALVAGSLTACAGRPASNDTFGLAGVGEVEGPSARNRQILVPQPSALKALDSEQIVIRPTPPEIQYLANSQWSDSLSKMVQAKLVQAFENSGRVGGVGMPGEGLAIDYQVVTDIRAFEVVTYGPPTAVVEISVKLLNDRNGTVKAQKIFRAQAPVRGTGNAAFVKGLDAAFRTVATEIVGWTLTSI